MSAPADQNEMRGEIREFLSSRRGRITPQQAGLPAYGANRRQVPGLRREEVALLAGVSADYYTRLEQGGASRVSATVVDAVARVLQLDEPERTHLYDLIGTAGSTSPSPRPRAARDQVGRTVQRILNSMHGTPALVLNGRGDILAANTLGAALYSPMYVDPRRPPNFPRFIFLDARSGQFFHAWDTVANDTVALLRAEAGRAPQDRGLSNLIGELATRSDDFRVRWDAPSARVHASRVKLLHHPIVGDLHLLFESFPLPADPSQSLVTYTAVPGSPSQEALNLLASWTATTSASPPLVRARDQRAASHAS